MSELAEKPVPARPSLDDLVADLGPRIDRAARASAEARDVAAFAVRAIRQTRRAVASGASGDVADRLLESLDRMRTAMVLLARHSGELGGQIGKAGDAVEAASTFGAVMQDDPAPEPARRRAPRPRKAAGTLRSV